MPTVASCACYYQVQLGGGEGTVPVISTLDWFVVIAYVALLVANGLRHSQRNRSPEDYFLASRAARWPTIGLALIASNMSSTALVGLAGAAYGLGISAYNYEWMAAVILVFFCVFLLPQVLQSRVFTMPEFLERRYDGRVRAWFTGLTLFLNVFVDGAGALYSGALVCRVLIPGAPLWLLAMILAGAAGIYTIVGGLRAVLRTEVIQAGVLMVGAVLVSVTAFGRAGGWHAVMSQVDPAKLSLIRPVGDVAVPWPGLLLGLPLLGFYYWCTNQVIVQRILSARDLDQGRYGALLAGLLKLPVLFLMVFPGTCALLLFPSVPRADLVYPTLIVQLLPAGVIGLLVAGFVAATMTAVASMLNSASTLITMDLAKRLGPKLSNEQTVRIGRISTAGCLVVAMLWAPQLEHMHSLWQYLQSMLAYAVPPVVVLFLAGLFWRGANAAGAHATFAIGLLLGILAFVFNAVLQVTHFHFLYVAPALFLVDLGILVVVSRLTRGRGPRADLEALHWSRAAYDGESRRLHELPWWRNYRVQSLALLAATASIVIAFR